MPRPTKAEEEAVEKYIRAVRRRWWWENNNKPMFLMAKPIHRRTTEMTAWKTRIDDPREFRADSTEYFPDIVQLTTKDGSDKASGQRRVSRSFSGPLAWTDKVNDLIVPEKPEVDPTLDILPWGMDTSRKRRIRRDFDYPENIFHRHAKEGYLYWPQWDMHSVLSVPIKKMPKTTIKWTMNHVVN